MTESRPALTADMSGGELQRWYWLRSELAGFARSVGVTATGGKQELTARLVAHLDGEPPVALPRAPGAAQKLLPEPITAATPLPAGQRCTQQLRRYFVAAIGPSFHFDAAMREFISGDAATTVGAAVDHWHRTRSRPRAEIGAQFELNRFLRIWHLDHPGGSRTRALLAWDVHRSLPVEARPPAVTVVRSSAGEGPAGADGVMGPRIGVSGGARRGRGVVGGGLFVSNPATPVQRAGRARQVGRRWLLVGIPPLVLAVVGVGHPMMLSPETSRLWTVLHVALIPVFPLLGVCLWFLLRHEHGLLAVAARVAAFVYACFYSALDTINGVAVGVLVSHAPGVEGPDREALLRPVLDLGNTLAWVGSSAFLTSAVLTSALAIRRCGRPALPGAVLTVLAAISFLDSHIYWPRGVLTMLLLAAGLLLLARHLEARRGLALQVADPRDVVPT